MIRAICAYRMEFTKYRKNLASDSIDMAARLLGYGHAPKHMYDYNNVLLSQCKVFAFRTLGSLDWVLCNI